MPLLFAFLIGLFTGLRSLTGPAVTAWAVYFGWLQLERPLSYIGSLPSVAILTLLAVLELVADKLPQTPNRTSLVGLSARILMGGLVGACVAAGGVQGALSGALLGAVGGFAGAFAGYWARTGIVRSFAIRDLYVALLEDLIAIIGSLAVLARF
jgi:uncharacterized membrane protein